MTERVMKSLNIPVPSALHKAIRLEAARQEMSIAELVRKAIAEKYGLPYGDAIVATPDTGCANG